MSDEEIQEGEVGDPSVPTDLLELHVLLEDSEVTPEEFKEAYSDETSDER